MVGTGTLQQIIWSVAPIVLLMVLLLGLKLKSYQAAVAGFVCAVLVGALVFQALPGAIALECGKGVWNTVVIYYVVFTAMFIYEALRKADMFAHIRTKMEQMLHDDLLRILFIGWGFTSFLQSMTGFGVPVAVCAPILVGLGVQALPAVIICILGHAWGGTFGTLAIAWDSLLMQTGVAPESAGNIAWITCVLLWLYLAVCGTVICLIYRGGRLQKKDWFFIACISLAQGGGQLLAAQVNTSVACFLASSLSLVVILLLDRAFAPKAPRQVLQQREGVPLSDILWPYAFLTALIVLLLFLPLVNRLLAPIQIGPRIPAAGGGTQLYSPVSIFTHSGTLLLFTGLFTYLFYQKKGYIGRRELGSALKNTLNKSLNSILPILFLVMMSKVMDGTGQIRVLSVSLVGVLGAAYPAVAPFIGILGSFISSSNMSSNILFSGFQQSAAAQLGIQQDIILAAQTAGGSIGNLTATSNIVLGLNTTGQPGREGEVLRKLLPVCLLSGAICSVAVMVFLALA